MTDFDTSDPPRYRFGLFGHRASGKSVYLLALGASRRTETDGVNAVFLRALAPEGVADPVSARSAEEIEREYAEALAALEKGRLPGQTDTIHGNLRYAFSLLNPAEQTANERGAAVLHLEISDHAGELVNRLTSEAEKATVLRSFLAERDGLVLVAEAPRPADESEQRTKALADVTELSARLSQVLENQPLESLCCRAVVLLVTKWDRIHPFDGFQKDSESASDFDERLAREEARHASLFEQWLETAEASEHRRLLNDLRTRFGGEAVRAYPVTAFGEANRKRDPDTGELVETPDRLPLATLNLVKPLRFLVERTDEVFRSALIQEVAQDDPGGALQFWRVLAGLRSDRSNLPDWSDIRPRFGSDPELRGAVESAHRRRRKTRTLQASSGGTVLALVAFGIALSHGLVIASKQRGAAEAALATPALEPLIAADVALASRGEATLLWPSSLSQRWLLPDSELESLRSRLIAAECDGWRARVNIQSGVHNPREIAEFEERIRDAPRCRDLSEAIALNESNRRSSEVLGQIDQLLNDYDFVRAIEQIFAATSNPAIPPETLRERLQGIDGRFARWAAQRVSRPDGDSIILGMLNDVLGALVTPPREFADTTTGVRELLESRRGPLELRTSCAGFQDLLGEARNLSRPSSGWPRLDRIDALLARIGQWPARNHSEFLQATAQLRRHVEQLKRLRIRGVRTSGALEGAWGDRTAQLTVSVGTIRWSGDIDTRREGDLTLEATLENGSLLFVELGSYPRIEVELREEGRFYGRQEWSGNLDGAAPSAWDAMRDTGWSVEFDLRRNDAQDTHGRINLTVLLDSPSDALQRFGLPGACNL